MGKSDRKSDGKSNGALEYTTNAKLPSYNITVIGKDDEDHLQNLSKLLTRLDKYGLR